MRGKEYNNIITENKYFFTPGKYVFSGSVYNPTSHERKIQVCLGHWSGTRKICEFELKAEKSWTDIPLCVFDIATDENIVYMIHIYEKIWDNGEWIVEKSSEHYTQFCQLKLENGDVKTPWRSSTYDDALALNRNDIIN
jgi:hypothetical protein